MVCPKRFSGQTPPAKKCLNMLILLARLERFERQTLRFVLMLFRGAKPNVKSSPPVEFVSNFAGMTVHSQSVERLPQGSPGLTTL
jgi:hypothetical protein